MRIRQFSSVSAWTAVGAFALAAALGGPLHGTSGASPAIATNLSGAQLFQVACASCHGLTGSGRVFTKGGQTITVPAITYTRLSKLYNKNFNQQVRGAIVRGLDEEGKPLNPMMPRWTNLSAPDLDKLIAYLKTLK